MEENNKLDEEDVENGKEMTNGRKRRKVKGMSERQRKAVMTKMKKTTKTPSKKHSPWAPIPKKYKIKIPESSPTFSVDRDLDRLIIVLSKKKKRK